MIACGALSLAFLGCQEEHIESHQLAKPKALRPLLPSQHKQRMLAVLVHQGERNWFFKLAGPIKTVGKYKDTFDRFLGSIRFTNDADRPLTWVVPEGWQEEAGAGMRYATLRTGPDRTALELTVIQLPGKRAGRVVPNINRWRKELGLLPIVEDDLDLACKEIEVDGHEAFALDTTGPGSKKPAMAAPFAGHPHKLSAPIPLKYETPKGWKKAPADPRFPSREAFQVEEDEQTAEVGLMPLGGDGGGLLLNVNRWRGEVGLKPIQEDQLEKDLRKLEVDGVESPYLDLVGPADSRPRQRILAVVVARKGQTWFITMKGPAGLVGGQKSNFEAFVQSIRFGGEGGNHE